MVKNLSKYSVEGVIIMNKRNISIWMKSGLVALILFIFTIINDLLYNNEIILTGYGNLLPLGVFLFIFSQSFILSTLMLSA